jgi:hypothetical protein
MSAENIPAGGLMETVVAGDYCVGYGACSLGQRVVDEPRSVCPLPAGAPSSPGRAFRRDCRRLPVLQASVSENEIAATAFPNTPVPSTRSVTACGSPWPMATARAALAHGFRPSCFFGGPGDHRPLRAARRTPVRHDWTPNCRKVMARIRQWTSKPSELNPAHADWYPDTAHRT